MTLHDFFNLHEYNHTNQEEYKALFEIIDKRRKRLKDYQKFAGEFYLNKKICGFDEEEFDFDKVFPSFFEGITKFVTQHSIDLILPVDFIIHYITLLYCIAKHKLFDAGVIIMHFRPEIHKHYQSKSASARQALAKTYAVKLMQ